MELNEMLLEIHGIDSIRPVSFYQQLDYDKCFAHNTFMCHEK